MERLTERCAFGVCGNNEKVKYYPLYAIAASDPLDYGIIGACFNKLADYEDAEENGLLLRLPVALGKPCYVIEKCKCNYRYKCRAQNNATANLKAKIVKDWKQYGNMRYCLKIYERPFKVGYMQFYGKTVFATLEEAHKVVTELAERG